MGAGGWAPPRTPLTLTTAWVTLNSGMWGVKIFWQFSIITLVRFDLVTQFCVVTQVGEALFLGVSHVHLQKGLQRPKIFETLTCAHANKFCMVIKLGVRQILYGRLRMLTLDLFVLANLLSFCFSKTESYQFSFSFTFSSKYHNLHIGLCTDLLL